MDIVSVREQVSVVSSEECGGEAVIEGNYRYLLRRWWSTQDKPLTWVLLNPSTANANEDDATLRRIISFTKLEGYSGLTVVNLFAYRSTSPKILRQVDNRIGDQNDRYIQEAAHQAAKIVVAWGAYTALQGRDRDVVALLEQPLWCLGTTRLGHPRHPLLCQRQYVPSSL